jgi:hypothetical protein
MALCAATYLVIAAESAAVTVCRCLSHGCDRRVKIRTAGGGRRSAISYRWHRLMVSAVSLVVAKAADVTVDEAFVFVS